jgi:hypothetical protein
MDDLDARLALIAKHAPLLRAAGVMAVSIGDIDFSLAPADPPVAETKTNTATPDDPDDPLKDPATCGGRLQRRRGERPVEEDEDHGRRSLVESA